MPFTPSHGVIALAFLRTPLVPAAVAVGAMTPDLPLFIRVGWPDYATTHDASALPITAMAAVLLLLVWRCLLRPSTSELLPLVISRRLPSEWDRSMGESFAETWTRRGSMTLRPSVTGVLLLLGSVAVGVLSHIVWDAFTHEGRWGSELLPLLDAQWGPFPAFRWLQHGSSFLGLAVIGVWALMRLRRTAPHRVIRRTPLWLRVSVWAALPVILVAAWIVGLVQYGPLTPDWTPAHLGYRVLPPAAAAWGVLLLVVGTVLSVGRRNGQLPRNSGGRPVRHARDASRFAGPRDPM